MHTYRQFLRPGSVIVIAVIFGVAVAILKGGDAGVRNVLGNVSAPWLLLPFFAGMLGRGPLRGGLIGAATTIAALIGFYVAQAFVLDLGNYPWYTDLALTVGSGRQYYAAGLVTGPLFGALGALRTRHRRALVTTVVGLAFVGEPLAVFWWLHRHGIASADTGFVVAVPALWLGEIALGLLLAVGIATGWRLSRQP